MPGISFTSGAWLDRLANWLSEKPLLIAVVPVLGAVLVVDAFLWFGAVLIAISIAGLICTRSYLLLTGCFILASVASFLHYKDLEQRHNIIADIGHGQTTELTLRVNEMPSGRMDRWSAICEETDGDLRVWLRGDGSIPDYGNTINVRGRIFLPKAPRNPGVFDRGAWLDRKGVHAVMDADSVSILRIDSTFWMSASNRFRISFREAITRGLEPDSYEASVIRAVVMGERPEDSELMEPFRLSGTLHLFAVSGMHVGMVGLFGWFLLRLLGVPRRWAIIPLIIVIFGYAWLTGFKPPAVRAAWMAALVLAAFGFKRRPNIPNALGLAMLLILLTDADLIFTAGVQLSFLVVLTIGLLRNPSTRMFAWVSKTDPFLPRSLYSRGRELSLMTRRRVADMFSVSTSAWFGSTPLVAFHFGLLTPISIISSVVLSVLVFPLLGIALLSAALSWLPGLSENLNVINSKLAGASVASARTSAAVPYSHLHIPRDRPAQSFLMIYDLGSDGAACWHDNQHTLLIDTGGPNTFQWEVLPSLRTMNLKPDSVVLTHPDGGHVGGFGMAIETLPIQRVMVPVVSALSAYYRDSINHALSDQIHVIRGRKGVAYQLSDHAKLEVLLEPNPWDMHQSADNRIMPVRLTWDGWKFLFLSDAGWGLERELLESGADLKADVIIAGRHQYDLSISDRLLNAVQAKVFVASHSNFPSEQKIPEVWRQACERDGIHIMHQGESGAVIIVPETDALKITGWLDGREILLRRDD